MAISRREPLNLIAAQMSLGHRCASPFLMLHSVVTGRGLLMLGRHRPS